MRKINAIIGPLLIVLLLIHGISGAMQLWGIIPGGSVIRRILSVVMAVLVGIHAVIGIKLTIDTLIACKKAGVSYWRNNERFWLSRISGFAMLFLIVYHVLIFSGTSGEAFRLHAFQGIQLAAHILLVVALAVHLITNIKPLFIALGLENRKFIIDIMIVVSLIMLVFAAAFIVYYLRWNVTWKY